jgi:two-component system, cell cycle response regulator
VSLPGPSPENGRAPRILVGTPDEVAIKRVREALRDVGYQVEVALDSETVMAGMEPRRYDMAILDSALEPVNGMTVAERLRMEPEGKKLYILALVDEGQDPPISAPVGPDDYLAKPFRTEDLVASVHLGMRMVGLERELDFAKQRMTSLSMSDPLTGLPSRQTTMDMIGTEIARQSRESPASCLAIVDISQMRSINGAFGERAGDLAIVRVARTLRSTAREADTVGRLGADKFAVVLYDCTPEDSETACNRLCDAVEYEPLMLAEGEVKVAITCGVVGLDPDFTANETLEAAKAALHTAKIKGARHVALAARYQEALY